MASSRNNSTRLELPGNEETPREDHHEREHGAESAPAQAAFIGKGCGDSSGHRACAERRSCVILGVTKRVDALAECLVRRGPGARAWHTRTRRRNAVGGKWNFARSCGLDDRNRRRIFEKDAARVHVERRAPPAANSDDFEDGALPSRRDAFA